MGEVVESFIYFNVNVHNTAFTACACQETYCDSMQLYGFTISHYLQALFHLSLSTKLLLYRVFILPVIFSMKQKHGLQLDSYQETSTCLTNDVCIAYNESPAGGTTFHTKRFTDVPTSHHSHTSSILHFSSSLATLHVLLIHPWPQPSTQVQYVPSAKELEL